MRIITLNVNGIRSADSKGLSAWLSAQNADVICLQEIKAQLNDIPESLRYFFGREQHFFSAEKKGYSGVGLLTRTQANHTVIGFDQGEFDAEGRFIRADFDKLSVLSVYFPSGSSGEERQAAKFRFLKAFGPYVSELKKTREVILCGDVNIAHQAIDLKNWKANQKKSGFTPEERSWMSEFLGSGWVDVYRQLKPEGQDYTWWSARGAAYTNDVGWRIDYQLATPTAAATARAVTIHRSPRFSDHAPLVVDYDLTP
ncbi:MAG: hypothetical protein RLZZ502_643 [Pseudomonadota bacterium]